MESLENEMADYKQLLEKGMVQKAYRGLIGFINDLKNHIQNENPTYLMAGHLHQGLMDITYFSFVPPALKKEKLKLVLLFSYERFRFEIWLCGQNKNVQKKYWEMFKGSDWNKYQVPERINDRFSIVENVLMEKPDFNDLNALQQDISKKARQFADDILEVFEW